MYYARGDSNSDEGSSLHVDDANVVISTICYRYMAKKNIQMYIQAVFMLRTTVAHNFNLVFLGLMLKTTKECFGNWFIDTCIFMVLPTKCVQYGELITLSKF